MPIAAFKIGLLGSVAIIEAIHAIVKEYPKLPVILDPITSAGGGAHVMNNEQKSALESLLLPYTTLLTPNAAEAKALTGQADCIGACAHELMAKGCQYVLVTDTQPTDHTITNMLWGHDKLLATLENQRLEGTFHGSGCTLAAAAAAYLAHGTDIISAARQGQQFTAQTIKHGRRLGMGQLIPQRFFWCNQEYRSEWHQAN